MISAHLFIADEYWKTIKLREFTEHAIVEILLPISRNDMIIKNDKILKNDEIPSPLKFIFEVIEKVGPSQWNYHLIQVKK